MRRWFDPRALGLGAVPLDGGVFGIGGAVYPRQVERVRLRFEEQSGVLLVRAPVTEAVGEEVVKGGVADLREPADVGHEVDSWERAPRFAEVELEVLPEVDEAGAPPGSEDPDQDAEDSPAAAFSLSCCLAFAVCSASPWMMKSAMLWMYSSVWCAAMGCR